MSPPPSVPPLCDACEGIGPSAWKRLTGDEGRDERFPQSSTYLHHQSFRLLQNSVRSCSLCAYILRGFEDRKCVREIVEYALAGKPTPVHLEHDPTDTYVGGRENIKFQITCGEQSDRVHKSWWQGNSIVIYFTPRESPSGEQSTVSVEGGIPTSWWPNNDHAEDRVSRVRNWLSVCRSKHPDCFPQQHITPRLPTRVIDVGSQYEEPHLHISAEHERAPYVTLSHCWGSNQPLTTTRETFENRRKEMPLSTFPKTYKDAVIITRSLGIRYLWIDSLCIIQDDSLDWMDQARQMSDVYLHAEMLIAAADAADSSEGCLLPRQQPWKLNYVPRRIFEFSHSNQQSLLVYPYPSFFNAIRNNRLNRRAWCLQELALSPRTLYCTRSQLYWQCGEIGFTECGIKPTQTKGRWTFGSDPVFNLPFHDQRDWTFSWWAVSMNFSTRQLTFPKDKLMAMAGITNFFTQKLDDMPAFGLWQKDLHYGLLWRCGREEMRRCTEPEGIPTWSWMSLDGPVKVPHHGLTRKQYTNLANITFQSGVDESKLVIKGRLLEGKSLGTTDTRIIDVKGMAARYGVLFSSLDGTEKNSNNEQPIGWHLFDLLPEETQRTMHCLEISFTKWGEHWHEIEGMTENRPLRTHNVLLLEKDAQEPDVYRRIGIGFIDHSLGVFERVEAVTLTLV